VNLRLIALLLAAWCALMIVPAIVISAVAPITFDSEPPGWIFGAWIGTYLVLWLADWSAPVSKWGLLGCTAVVVGFSLWFYPSLSRRNSLQRGGIPARGVVLEVEKPWMNVVINNIYIKRTLRLRIERADGVAPYEAKFKGTFMLGQIPGVGSRLALRVDPANPRHFEAVSEDSEYSAPEPEPSERTITDQLQRLAELHRRGDLSDAEFAAAKQRILNRFS